MHEYSKETNNTNYIEIYEGNIKSLLSSIIEMEKDYILTDSFLCYMAIDKVFLLELESIISNDLYLNVSFLNYYYQFSIEHFRNNNEDRCTYLKLLDNDTKKVINEACNFVEIINELNDYKRYFINIINITLSYCHLNNRMNDFSYLFSYLLSNKELIIDDIELNNIREIADFTCRIIYFLDNIEKKKIIIK